MMILNFSKLYKPMLFVSGAITLIGIVFLLIFSGGTFATFTVVNLRISLFVKAFVSSVLVFGTTLLYFLIRFKKKGIFLGAFSALSSVISAVVAFALCILCRAPLGEYTFALMLYAVAMSYITSVFFANNLAPKKVSRKKDAVPVQDNYSFAAQLTWQSLAYIIAVISLVIVAGFIASIVFAVKVVPMYALPSIIVTVFSVVQTISVGCKLYASKV